MPDMDNSIETRSFPDTLRTMLLYLAWTAALVATLGSLFFSEIMNFIPCELCWYQRIFMYPLVFILTIGILARDHRVVMYVVPICVVGLGISVYHNLLYYGIIPEGLHMCTAGVPCETRWIQWLGFMGIPFLALTAFFIIILCLLWYRRPNDNLVSEDFAITIPGWVLSSTSGILILGYIFLLVTAATNGSG